MSAREDAIKETTEIFQAMTKGIEPKGIMRHRATKFVDAMLAATKEERIFSEKKTELLNDKNKGGSTSEDNRKHDSPKHDNRKSSRVPRQGNNRNA